MELKDWLSIIGVAVTIVVSVIAYRASRNAQVATQQFEKVESTIKLALGDFKDAFQKELSEKFFPLPVAQLKLQSLEADNEKLEVRLNTEIRSMEMMHRELEKRVDGRLNDIDHKVSRNTDHIAILFKQTPPQQLRQS